MSFIRCEANEAARLAHLESLLAAGVSIPCISGVIVEESVQIGSGVTILPGTMLFGQSKIGDGSVIGPNCVLRDTVVGENCTLNNVHAMQASVGDQCEIGPFVRLRSGTKLARGVRIGNFVEIKNATIGKGTKVAHLSYIGDADFGADINVGCGLAVANYDGQKKHRTVVGDGAFIGCHNSLVAPVTVGERAYTAAGSVITDSVPAHALAIARARQVTKAAKSSEEKEEKK
ncbi:MAG: UDP-N-acetylglucosamine diphosphorylase [Oscillospiraceae bacterium]|nr:UDP-N-acetylglucosamine diphosphorylase [Oscillospiraceae bacterium]